MMYRIRIIVAIVWVLLLVIVPVGASADESETRGQSSGDDRIEVESWWSSVRSGIESKFEELDSREFASPGGAAQSSERSCKPTLYVFGIYREVIIECDGAGGTEFAPVFERGEGEVVDPAGVERWEVSISRHDVESLIVNPGNLIVQPDRPWVLVNADTVVMTDAAEHVLSTRVLDLDIDVRVTPVLYTWDFGDGSAPLTGSDPGAPWPDHTVSHVYGEAGTVTISLRTEWDAAFRVEGTSTWIPVTGRAVTTQSTDSIEVVTATPRLTTG